MYSCTHSFIDHHHSLILSSEFGVKFILMLSCFMQTIGQLLLRSVIVVVLPGDYAISRKYYYIIFVHAVYTDFLI